jgi:hypothetical protein
MNGRQVKHNLKPGQRFGRLTTFGTIKQGRNTVWICDCDCGQTTLVPAFRLASGETRSCGCFKRELLAKGQVRHGAARVGAATPEYRAWRNMIERCSGRDPRIAKHYIHRGVRVCDKWLNSFEAFLADVGPRPSKAHSLDRYPDNNGNYEPGNVRWATRKEQARNKRDNVVVVVDGVEMTLTDAATLAGLPLITVSMRLIRLGWTIERALGLGPDHIVKMIGRRGGKSSRRRSAGDAA